MPGRSPQWRRALVTGASSGIGRALAVELAAGGTDLVLVARRKDRLDELAAAVGGNGISAEVIVADLVDPDGQAQVARRLAADDSPVDLLVNNAGFGTTGPFAASTLEVELEEIELNVVALVRLTHAALPGMLRRGQGSILNMSSLSALQPMPYSATYGATKAYVTSFSEALHEELRRKGVSVLAVMPGFTTTEFQERAGVDRSIVPGPAWMTAEAVARSSLKALARRRAGHVPGAHYRVLAFLSRVTPWSVSRRIVTMGSRDFKRARP